MSPAGTGAEIPWLIVWASFLIGVACGAYVLAAMAGAFGSEETRGASRPGFLLAGPLLAGCGGICWPRFDPTGQASLAILGTIALGSFLSAMAELGARGSGRVAGWNRSRVGKTVGLVGAVAAMVVAARVAPLPAPEWVGAGWLGAAFLASAVATGSAVVVLNAQRVGHEAAADRLATAIAGAVVLELAILTGLTLSLRGISGLAFQRWPGRLIPLFVVPMGLVLPLVMKQVRGPRGLADAAWLILLGGLVLRAAVAGVPGSLTLR